MPEKKEKDQTEEHRKNCQVLAAVRVMGQYELDKRGH